MVLRLLLIVLLTLAACRQPEPTPNPSVTMTLVYEPDPARVGQAELVISLTDAAGQPVNGARLNIRGDMSHAGMAPVLREAQDGENGIYRVPFEWTMAGDWFVEVTAALPDGSTAAQRFDLSVAP